MAMKLKTSPKRKSKVNKKLLLKRKITKIIYQNSNDDSQALRIRFEIIDEVIDLLVTAAIEHNKTKKL